GDELALGARRCPDDVAHRAELSDRITRQAEIVEDVALHHLLPVAPYSIVGAEWTAAGDVVSRPVHTIVNRVLGARSDTGAVRQRHSAHTGRQGPDVGPVRPDVGGIAVVLIARRREDRLARDFLVDGGPLRRRRESIVDRLQRPSDRALTAP